MTEPKKTIQQILDEQKAIVKEKGLRQDDTYVALMNGAQIRKNDPEWKRKTKENRIKQANDPAYQRKITKVNQDKAKDPNWIKAQKEGAKKYWNTEEGKKDRSVQQKLNWVKHRDKMCKALKDRYADGQLGKKVSQGLFNSDKVKENGKRNRVPLVTPDGIFDSRISASKYYNVHSTAMNTRLKNKPSQYFYITQEGFARLKFITDPIELS